MVTNPWSFQRKNLDEYSGHVHMILGGLFSLPTASTSDNPQDTPIMGQAKSMFPKLTIANAQLSVPALAILYDLPISV